MGKPRLRETSLNAIRLISCRERIQIQLSVTLNLVFVPRSPPTASWGSPWVLDFRHFVLLVHSPTETQALCSGNSCQKLLLRGLRCRKTKAKGTWKDEPQGAGKRPLAHVCRHLRVTLGTACPWDPAAPAKLQNNEAVAAKPKSGAKNPWNARPRAAGHTEHHLKEGFSSASSNGPTFARHCG